MDTLRKQASKLRVQAAKQQQAVLKQLTGSGYESSNVMIFDEAEMQTHQQLEKFYRSTRAGRDFQKDIVKAAEAFSVIAYQHIDAGNKLSKECHQYGTENSENILGQAAAIYGDGYKYVEKEQEDLNRMFHSQILDPLKAMITGTPLEDARHLAQRYSKMRHEAEAQVAEISRRQAKVQESPIPENIAKLNSAEAKLQGLKSNMAVLGKEAVTALAAVDAQQQRLTFQRLVSWVEGEKNCHLRIAAVLAGVETEMLSEKQRREAAPPVVPTPIALPEIGPEKTLYFLAEAKHAFYAEAEKELSLEQGDFVVVRKVSPSGWSEGECKGKAGWFPSAYVERRQGVVDPLK